MIVVSRAFCSCCVAFHLARGLDVQHGPAADRLRKAAVVTRLGTPFCASSSGLVIPENMRLDTHLRRTILFHPSKPSSPCSTCPTWQGLHHMALDSCTSAAGWSPRSLKAARAWFCKVTCPPKRRCGAHRPGTGWFMAPFPTYQNGSAQSLYSKRVLFFTRF